MTKSINSPNVTEVSCPTCNKKVKWQQESTFRPFCSKRCRMIDFGAWAAEDHKIPGNPVSDDIMSGELESTY